MAEGFTFSIIIPTYNEEEDVVRCLDAVFDLDPPADEVIVVDDASTDDTTDVVSEYDVSLLVNDENKGVAATRNRGIEHATGDVVVLLNADVLLPADFIEQVRPHYEAGADFVSCNSQVKNTDEPIGCYIQAKKDHELARGQTYTWSEGWSARRAVLLEEGGFDEGFPSASGEDAALADYLYEQYDGHIADEIEIPHIAPREMDEFRSQRFGRGRGRFYYAYLREETPLWKLLAGGLVKGAVALVLFPLTVLALTIGGVYRGYQYHQYCGDFPLKMICLTGIDFLENRRGYYESLLSEV